MTATKYGQFRAHLVARILSEGLTPAEVAKVLGENADQYPEITYDECRRLRSMGEKWTMSPQEA